MVITAAGDSSTQRGGGIGKSLGWENVVSPSNQVTVIVSTTNKHVHISFYGTGDLLLLATLESERRRA